MTPEGHSKWKIPGRGAKGAGGKECGAVQMPQQKLILSEDIKEHLKVIVAAMVSDMLPRVRFLVASDPRIQRFSLANSPRFKEQIIKAYKASLVAKRKCEVGLLRAASKMASANVSTKAYRAIRSILVEMGFAYVMPTERDLDEARKKIEECAMDDLQLKATEDGWFVSPTAAVELDLLRQMQMATVKKTRNASGARLIGFSGPGMHGWQPKVRCKITLDARTITKKTSQTEVTMQAFKGGTEGESDSHRALSLRTLGMWMGKDSRGKVEANMTEFFEELQQINEHGVVFNREKQTFLGQAAVFRGLSEEEQGAVMDDGEKKYCPVKIDFFLAADMAALCAVVGHGCAGHHYCSHCMAHADERHLPYELVTTKEDTTLQAMAHEYDMHARTLYAINARVDHKDVQPLTRDGLRASTVLDAAARAREAEAEPESEMAGARRPKKRAKKVPVAKSEPDERMMKALVGWKEEHKLDCHCEKCFILKGTCVRVIPRPGFERTSAFLKEHCPSLTPERCPFCALHCNMRVTEALFHQICQAAGSSKSSSKLIERMNAALHELGINRSYKKSEVTGNYEKVSFEGHQALDLLAKGRDGKMGIERVLEAIWPGAVDDSEVTKVYQADFVMRTIEVWRQWAVVVKLMSERFTEKLEKDIVGGENGFERFGKECREFIFRFQSMSTVDYSKAFYLHTILHHAGDFMRALQAEGLTLGMMSNSACERRHEYGRRAARKALASNAWCKKIDAYKNRPNLLVYLTMKEINMFDYGEDLISHEAARISSNGELSEVRELLDGARVNWTIRSRRSLLSDEEMHQEFEAGPNDPPPTFETSDKNIWGEKSKKNAFALIGLRFEDAGEGAVTGFDPDLQAALFDGVPVYVTDEDSAAGSDEDMQIVHGMTLNSFDFPEQDEDEDENYAVREGPEKYERFEFTRVPDEAKIDSPPLRRQVSRRGTITEGRKAPTDGEFVFRAPAQAVVEIPHSANQIHSNGNLPAVVAAASHEPVTAVPIAIAKGRNAPTDGGFVFQAPAPSSLASVDPSADSGGARREVPARGERGLGGRGRGGRGRL